LCAIGAQNFAMQAAQPFAKKAAAFLADLAGA